MVPETITFYRQKRVDGGVRMGVMRGERMLFHKYTPGKSKHPDPALEWFVDVSLRGKDIPEEPEELRRWLVEQWDKTREALESLAQDFVAGTDFSPPFRREFTAGEIEGQVTFSAIRRIDCLEMARIFRDVARNGRRYLRQLEEWSEPATTAIA